MFKTIIAKITILLIAIMIFSVIFISWGLDDIDGLLAHPARMTLLLILLAQLLIILFIPLGWKSTRLPAEPDENNMLVTFIGTMGILLFLMISPFSDRHEWAQLWGGDTMRYIGLFLFSVGAIFSTWAAFHLCKQFNLQAKNQHDKLVTDGPFKYIRHPRDLGSILLFIGTPLVFLSGLGLLLAFLSAAGLFERISREERVLQQKYKEEWLMYAEKTKCLIPWA